jgi:hypothetical protein
LIEAFVPAKNKGVQERFGLLSQQKKTHKEPMKKFLSLFLGLTTVKASASPIAAPISFFPMMAQAAGGNLRTAFGYILTIITAIAFIMGVISVIQGARAINRGEEGKLQIAGGVLTALAIPIMKYIYSVVVPGSGVESIQLNGL